MPANGRESDIFTWSVIEGASPGRPAFAAGAGPDLAQACESVAFHLRTMRDGVAGVGEVRGVLVDIWKPGRYRPDQVTVAAARRDPSGAVTWTTLPDSVSPDGSHLSS